MSLLACPACTRHVRRTESTCPFCKSALSLPPEGARQQLPRLGRAATFAFGAVLTSATAGCPGAPVPLYGGPSDDAGTDSPSAIDTGDLVDTGGPGPLYGAPPDAGATDAAATDAGQPEEDAGGPAPLYGGAPVDAGVANDTGGGSVPLYGGPPPAE